MEKNMELKELTDKTAAGSPDPDTGGSPFTTTSVPHFVQHSDVV